MSRFHVGTELLCLLEAKEGFCPILFFVIIGENMKVTVPIGECDLEMFEGLVGENTFYSKRSRSIGINWKTIKFPKSQRIGIKW